MKNIQVIDGAANCTYDIFAATEEKFSQIFLGDTDIEFNTDVYKRLGEEKSARIFGQIWQRKLDKTTVNGIHGTLFYGLDKKKEYYPTKKDSDIYR